MSGLGNGHPRDLLSDYLDDELGFEERASVDRHLAGCEDCRVELEALRRLTHALADFPVPPVPVDLVERIGQRLDTATVVRPKRWRFALPATIAATLGAIGLLVVIQWRGEGRVSVPAAPEPQRSPLVFDETKPSNAPAAERVPNPLAAPLRKKEAQRSDALDKDVAASRGRDFKPDAGSTPGGAPGGVVGGVVGGTVSGVAGGTEDRAERRAAAQRANQTSQPMAAPPAAKAEARSVCEERWSDSGLRATWEVPDVVSAVTELNLIARAVGGTHVWRGIVEGGAYVLVIPRGSFEEVFFALRARGMTGLGELPALGPGSDCAGISIVLEASSGTPSPAPR